MADPELAKREIDRPRRSAVPVDRVLQPVCVQVARPGDVPLGVFLWHPKVHVEEQELPVRWSRLRVLPVERLAEPFDMDEPVVLRQALDRSICDARPGQESAVENPNVEDPQPLQSGSDRGGFETGAVDDHRSLGHDLLGHEESVDLGFVNAVQPAAREGHGARNVPSARLIVKPPAVVCRQRSDIDDGEGGVLEPRVKLVG